MRQDGINIYQQIAYKRGGRCLTTSYHSQKQKIKFKCKLGHSFSALAGNVKRGSWCPKCARILTNAALSLRKPKLTDLQSLAKSRKGKLISKSYPSSP